MDSIQNHLSGEIQRTGNCLLELLRRSLCPDHVREKDHILLTSPWEEADFRVGVYLYDLQDYSSMATQETVLGEDTRRFPPKAVELSYMIFCNEKHRFGGVQRERIYMTLNEIVRAVYDNPVLETADGEELQLSFLRESVEFKIQLWESFSQPLQPAVYVRTVPVLIASRRIRRATGVKERDLDMKKM